jgi:hypothetical protein
MATAIIKYDMEDPHDKLEFKRATSATDVYLVIWEIQQELRRLYKYEPINADGSPQYDTDTIEYIRDFLYKTLESHDVDMNNLE